MTLARLHLMVIAVIAAASVSSPSAADDGIEFFERRIRPLLANHCYECHGAEEQESGLRLDSPAAILAGGKAGPLLVRGKPDVSLLVAAVKYVDENLQMPPDGKLKDAEIADLVRWIEIGAPMPAVDSPAAQDAGDTRAQAKAHWAFQPPQRPPVPDVNLTSWPRTTVDRFILAKLEQHGLTPAPTANKRALLRRATYDLTGLPPTPGEISEFLNDDSPDAFAKVVDRLLASPRYGERWGRHWLDVARYADSNGLDENIAHGNAWRYRDYVVDSFNQDKPYDVFVREQIAGDLLPAADDDARNQQLIATGYLALGPKVLAEVDKQKMEMDIIDEQIDTLGKSLIGLTLGCARCHDHKFDPVSTRDYYALAGIFKSTRTMESLATIGRWHENQLADKAYEQQKAAHAANVAAANARVTVALNEATEALRRTLGEGAAFPAKPEETFPAETKKQLAAIRAEVAAMEKAAPVAPAAMGVTESKATDVAIHLRGSHLTLGEVAPRGFPEVLCRDDTLPPAKQLSGRLELAQWLTDAQHPLTARVIVNRVWRWHFGRGLVATPDNFGLLGEAPSHPELLDWLAVEFVERGWSLKDLHRTLMLSATYQMDSRGDAEAARDVDPRNRLFWRANLRRLEAEELRDTLLAVSDDLDEQRGGSLLKVANRAFFFDHTSKDETTYDSRRRSIYLPVVRNHLADSFTLFDYADASVINGDRPTSTVASQALFLLNSQAAATAAEGLARNLLTSPDFTSDDDRIRQAFVIAYARPATDEEIEAAKAFVARCASQLDSESSQLSPEQRQLECWRLLCQSLLISNEFIYLQ